MVKVVLTDCCAPPPPDPPPVPVPTIAWTLTRSPGTNGLAGRKLSPAPVE